MEQLRKLDKSLAVVRRIAPELVKLSGRLEQLAELKAPTPKYVSKAHSLASEKIFDVKAKLETFSRTLDIVRAVVSTPAPLLEALEVLERQGPKGIRADLFARELQRKNICNGGAESGHDYDPMLLEAIDRL